MQSLPIVVDKVWGQEVWLVNETEYCLKILEIKAGAAGSLHYHRIKKETFILQKGKILLQIGNEGYLLGKDIKPMTINPKTPHRIIGIEDSLILEVSTHHDDADVERLEPSRAA